MATAPCLLQFLLEARPSQVMLDATFSPACRTVGLVVVLALQASLDQIGNPPVVIASALAFGPMSRVHAKLPMFWIVSVSRGVAPTG